MLELRGLLTDKNTTKGAHHASLGRAVVPMALVFVCIFLGAARAGWSQQIRPADLFKPVQLDLENQLRTLRASDLGQDKGFNADDVNGILTNTSREILKKLPANDAPLIHYVQAKIPKPVDNSKVLVSKSEAESKFGALQGLLRGLNAMPSFVLDLTINTSPSGAKFDLIPPVGSSSSVATNSILTNVYRGEYSYSISKKGYKSVSGTINFIERSGDVLECVLFSESVGQDPLPCNLK
jgi:hypothetical protein